MNLFILNIKQEKKWNFYKFFLLLSIIIIIQGCAPRSDKNKTLSPPADTKWITVGIKLPEGIDALPLNVLYRSYICQRAQYNSAGKKEYIPGFNPNAITLKQQGNSNIYQAQIALNGGGGCQWQLSEVWMSIIYKNTLDIYRDFEVIPSHKLILVFKDHNFRPEGLIRELIKNGKIELNYYPIVINNKMANEKKIILFNNWDRPQYILVNNEKNILFTPILHKDNITKVDMPKERGSANIIYYSDGTIEEINSSRPNYNKLMDIDKNQ